MSCELIHLFGILTNGLEEVKCCLLAQSFNQETREIVELYSSAAGRNTVSPCSTESGLASVDCCWSRVNWSIGKCIVIDFVPDVLPAISHRSAHFSWWHATLSTVRSCPVVLAAWCISSVRPPIGANPFGYFCELALCAVLQCHCQANSIGNCYLG